MEGKNQTPQFQVNNISINTWKYLKYLEEPVNIYDKTFKQKQFAAKRRKVFSQMTPSEMFDKILNTPVGRPLFPTHDYYKGVFSQSIC